MSKRKQDAAAAKAKKQKIMLIVGGVLLLAVAGIQVPKLMKGSGSEAVPAVATTVPGAPVATPAAGAVAVVAAPTAGSAVVAGVSLPRASAVKVETSQLASFTLFEPKDPFVPQVSSETSTSDGTSTSDTAPPADTSSTDSSSSSSGGSSGSTASTKPAPPAPIVYATIDFNGKPQQVEVKDTFPTPEPLFILRSVTKKQAKISVAGGSFDGGEPVTLKFGKKVTLVNTATGVRYVLRLVYTGAQPEVIEGFTTAGTGGSSSGAATTSGTATTTPAK